MQWLRNNRLNVENNEDFQKCQNYNWLGIHFKREKIHYIDVTSKNKKNRKDSCPQNE